MSQYDQPLPVLPVRDTVLFPHAVLPLTVGRESSILLIESLGEQKNIVVVAQREPKVDAPQPVDLYSIGTVATVHKVVAMPNQSLFVFTEGLERVRLRRFTQLTPFARARFEIIPEVEAGTSIEAEALQRNIRSLFQREVAGLPTLSDELQTVAFNIEEPGRLMDFISSSLPFLSTPHKQEILETTDIYQRMCLVHEYLTREAEIQRIRTKIQNDVQNEVENSQRRQYLREQARVIQRELDQTGGESPSEDGNVPQSDFRRKYLEEQLAAIQQELGNESESSQMAEILQANAASSAHDNNRAKSAQEYTSQKIFIVHGHDHLLLKDLELYLRRWSLDPIVLSEKPNRGMTLIEKVEANTDVAFAFVLLTRDDVGGKGQGTLQSRARQNVIWEWGYLVGRLGRHKVCCLYHEGVELPSDLHGTVTIVIRTEVAHNLEEIRRELTHAGFTIPAFT